MPLAVANRTGALAPSTVWIGREPLDPLVAERQGRRLAARDTAGSVAAKNRLASMAGVFSGEAGTARAPKRDEGHGQAPGPRARRAQLRRLGRREDLQWRGSQWMSLHVGGSQGVPTIPRAKPAGTSEMPDLRRPVRDGTRSQRRLASRRHTRARWPPPPEKPSRCPSCFAPRGEACEAQPCGGGTSTMSSLRAARTLHGRRSARGPAAPGEIGRKQVWAPVEESAQRARRRSRRQQ